MREQNPSAVVGAGAPPPDPKLQLGGWSGDVSNVSEGVDGSGARGLGAGPAVTAPSPPQPFLPGRPGPPAAGRAAPFRHHRVSPFSFRCCVGGGAHELGGRRVGYRGGGKRKRGLQSAWCRPFLLTFSPFSTPPLSTPPHAREGVRARRGTDPAWGGPGPCPVSTTPRCLLLQPARPPQPPSARHTPLPTTALPPREKREGGRRTSIVFFARQTRKGTHL